MTRIHIITRTAHSEATIVRGTGYDDHVGLGRIHYDPHPHSGAVIVRGTGCGVDIPGTAELRDPGRVYAANTRRAWPGLKR